MFETETILAVKRLDVQLHIQLAMEWNGKNQGVLAKIALWLIKH